jgi:hypothetical protein
MLEASTQTAAWIAENWRRVQAEIADAALAAGRRPEEVLIVGVSKYVDVDLTAQLVEAGCSVLGENRPQNLWNKADALQTAGRAVQWHLIGHLQRNKIRRTLPHITWLHSLDSLRLAEALNAELETTQATAANSVGQLPQRLNVLLEVNITQDAAKTGLMTAEVPALVDRLVELPYLRLGGLMAMSSRESGGAETQREFATVRQLRDELQAKLGSAAQLDQLSMGMSGDYREAIAEGASMVRIGSSLWQNIL